MVDPRTDELVLFDSAGPSGNAYAVVGATSGALKSVDRDLAKEFRGAFKLTDCKDYDEVISRCREWVDLVDIAGKY